MIPHVQQFLDSNPYLKDVIVPVSLTVTGTLFAWIVMPRILRRFHTYAMQSSAKLLPVGFSNEDIPYEKSFWGALEDPARYLVTFIAFAQIAAMVAPTTIAAQYFSPTVKGAVILSVVWFLYRWKTNVITRMLSAKSFGGLDRDKVLTLDKVSSVGLFAIGLMASAEACGVAVQSILTVVKYPWKDINCSYVDNESPRIISLNLSSSGLTGEIDAAFSNLTLLHILNLEGNKLSGAMSASSVTGVLGLVVAIALFLQYKKRHRNGGSGDGVRTGPMDTTKRYYKYSEVVKVTNNFERVLGQGGFGKVYHGVLNDDQVELLLRVHHKNLTALIGYCHEGKKMALIYEFMANGTLGDYLSGQPVIARSRTTAENIHITESTLMLSTGDIRGIVDPKLGERFDAGSAWKITEVAMACASSSSKNRPRMSHVVAELKESVSRARAQQVI
uniref:A_IG005I10.14 protein n=1 Tax=Arabidopsis thaliana TaxID=3702 RepID=O23079_ARATH|nr:similar to light repressible receptor protein kinase [Arabidopsis thaliana]AAF02791.1 similar to light repressible receptor protein kinase [Arabidopsis thaliana]